MNLQKTIRFLKRAITILIAMFFAIPCLAMVLNAVERYNHKKERESREAEMALDIQRRLHQAQKQAEAQDWSSVQETLSQANTSFWGETGEQTKTDIAELQTLLEKARLKITMDSFCTDSLSSIRKKISELPRSIGGFRESNRATAEPLASLFGRFTSLAEAEADLAREQSAAKDEEQQIVACRAVLSFGQHVDIIRFEVLSRLPSNIHSNGYLIQDESRDRAFLVRNDDTVYTTTGWAQERLVRSPVQLSVPGHPPLVTLTPDSAASYMTAEMCRLRLLKGNESASRATVKAQLVSTEQDNLVSELRTHCEGIYPR